MLNDYLESYFLDEELKSIFQDVMGNQQVDILNEWVVEAVETHLSSSIQAVLFIQSSIGVVFGFLLDNNQKVVLKVYSPKLSKTYLEEMNRIQRLFFDKQFPAPQVISPIFQLGSSHAGFYQCIEGNKANPHQPAIRDELAYYLARFSKIVEANNITPMINFFQQAGKKQLWPTPHNLLFDLKRSTQGAGWIAKKAQRARKRLAQSSLKKRLAHTDWGIKNALFHEKQLVGIFDWDSLGSMSEPEMVGRAAAQFTADWEMGLKVTPSPEEGRLFVKSYEDYSEKKFSREEYELISGSADYLISIIARFEHAGNDPSSHPYQDLLKDCGETGFLFSF